MRKQLTMKRADKLVNLAVVEEILGTGVGLGIEDTALALFEVACEDAERAANPRSPDYEPPTRRECALLRERVRHRIRELCYRVSTPFRSSQSEKLAFIDEVVGRLLVK
jgi:hypothetical protein